MEEEVEVDRPPFARRIAGFLDRAEHVYLRVLRATVLVVATGLILLGLGLASVSLYRVLQSPNSVREKPATVSPQEIAAADPKPVDTSISTPGVNPVQRRAYDSFVGRYYALFRSRFEPFRQKEDKQLSRSEFDDNFVGTQSRLKAVDNGQLNFDSDLADLQSLLSTMTDAATLPETQRKLQGYRAARKVQVCRSVERTRPTQQSGWDRYSTSCPAWYEEPIGCATTRTVDIPYTTRECAMRFPEGTQSYSRVFRAYQDKFFELLRERRTRNSQEAQAAREGILANIAKGKIGFITALELAAAFLLLMFFFLLIAIERHQRRLSAVLATD